ncbi:DUF5723 family protein [Botryobacter ruber]|uniref:DUF5723 family protein n=1 Tax=Botryobacter ruber TaxID=2171629 RepID=UPI000FEC5E0F|nr:DUF5723 family protein [Botryobacter ruber]
MKLKFYPLTVSFAAVLLARVFSPETADAQQLGLANTNYGGTNSLYTNPSAIADARHSFYLNLFSADAGITNDYLRYEAPVSIFKLFKDEMEFKDEYIKENLNGKAKMLVAGADLRGPAFMLRLSPKHSIAFSSRMRGGVQIHNLSEDIARVGWLYKTEGGEAEDLVNEVSDNTTMNLNANLFSELAFSYARVLVDQDRHFLKAGITVKKLAGLYSAYFINEDTRFEVHKQPGGDDYDYVLQLDKIQTKYGYLTDDAFGGMDSFEEKDPAELLKMLTGIGSPGKGWGADFGLTYEFRPNIEKYQSVLDGEEVVNQEKNKYKFRVGIGLMDVGSILYDNPDYVKGYYLNKENKELRTSDFEDAESVEEIADIMNEALGVSDADRISSFRSGLPTALNLNVDYNVAGPLYLNATLIKNLRGEGAIGMRQNSLVAVTPRLEFKKFEIALPVAAQNEYSVLTVGTMVRFGNVFIGSDNIGSVFNYGNPHGANVYMGVSLLPILKRNKKDKDKDGVSNRKDQCKKVPGTLELMGCPDKDNDGVADKDDACPDVPGTVELKGCPAPVGGQ